jgi:hypothetical protein
MKHNKNLASFILQRNNTHKPMSFYYKKTCISSPLKNEVLFENKYNKLNKFLLYKKKIVKSL